jgi:hypothetical protein
MELQSLNLSAPWLRVRFSRMFGCRSESSRGVRKLCFHVATTNIVGCTGVAVKPKRWVGLDKENCSSIGRYGFEWIGDCSSEVDSKIKRFLTACWNKTSSSCRLEEELQIISKCKRQKCTGRRRTDRHSVSIVLARSHPVQPINKSRYHNHVPRQALPKLVAS